MASPASPNRTTRRRSGPDGRDRASATSSAPTIGSIVTPSTWHCIVIAVPTPASSHQRGSRRRPGPPGTGQRDRARQRDEVRVPDERRFLDRRGRDRHREAGHEAGHRAPDRPCQPPRHEDRGDPRQRDERRHRERRIAAGQERRRGEQVVVERAVVDVTDRGRRSEQRDHAVAHEGPQHQHVVALVGVPRPARGQVRQPQQGRQHEQADRDQDERESRSRA